MRSRWSGERHTKRRNRIVIDTSVIVSALAFGGVPEKALQKALRETDIYVSQALLEEYRRVPLQLMEEKKINHEQMKALIAGMAALVGRATVIGPMKELSICRDPADNILLECSLAARANILITGDKDLLTIKELPFKLAILTPRRFLIEG